MDNTHDEKTAASVQGEGSWTGCIAGVAVSIVSWFAVFALIPVAAVALPVAAGVTIASIAGGNKVGEKAGLY